MLPKTNSGYTFEPVSSVKVLASEYQCEQEDGQQAERANQHSAQIDIFKTKIENLRKSHRNNPTNLALRRTW